jgi:hypothetical protein
MKKIFVLFVIVLFFLKMNAQVSYNFGFSFSNYGQTNSEFVYVNPAVDGYIELGYYLRNNFGIVSGVHSNNRFFDVNNQRIISKNIQIPLLLSRTKKIENTPFGLTSYLGYILTIPYETKTSQNISYDMGVIHGLYARNTVDLWIKGMKMYSGVDFSIDLMNENDIKFYKIGIIMGCNIFF